MLPGLQVNLNLQVYNNKRTGKRKCTYTPAFKTIFKNLKIVTVFFHEINFFN